MVSLFIKQKKSGLLSFIREIKPFTRTIAELLLKRIVAFFEYVVDAFNAKNSTKLKIQVCFQDVWVLHN